MSSQLHVYVGPYIETSVPREDIEDFEDILMVAMCSCDIEHPHAVIPNTDVEGIDREVVFARGEENPPITEIDKPELELSLFRVHAQRFVDYAVGVGATVEFKWGVVCFYW